MVIMLNLVHKEAGNVSDTISIVAKVHFFEMGVCRHQQTIYHVYYS